MPAVHSSRNQVEVVVFLVQVGALSRRRFPHLAAGKPSLIPLCSPREQRVSRNQSLYMAVHLLLWYFIKGSGVAPHWQFAASLHPRHRDTTQSLAPSRSFNAFQLSSNRSGSRTPRLASYRR